MHFQVIVSLWRNYFVSSLLIICKLTINDSCPVIIGIFVYSCSNTARTSHARHAQRTGKNEGKRGQSIKTFIFRSWSCYLCQTYLFSSKRRVQLHGGTANWWSCCSRVGLVEPEPSQTRPKVPNQSLALHKWYSNRCGYICDASTALRGSTSLFVKIYSS
jgi:hypothetical protein